MIKAEAGQIPQNTLVRVKLWGFEDEYNDNDEIIGVMRYIPEERMILFLNNHDQCWLIPNNRPGKLGMEFANEFPQFKRGWWVFDDNNVAYTLFQNEE